MPSLRNVLYMAWSVKALVQHTIGQFKAFPSRKRDENDSDDDEYFTKTMEHPSEDEFNLPDTFTTPEQPIRTRAISSDAIMCIPLYIFCRLYMYSTSLAIKLSGQAVGILASEHFTYIDISRKITK